MDSNKLCDPCERTSKSSFAVKYCSDCEEFLCSECAVDHSKFKVFVSHHVVDVNVTDDQSFVVSKKCPTHKDMTLDFFCSDHDSICCKSCIASMHRACENIKPLDVAAKGVIHSSMYEEFATDMVSLNNAANQLTDEWKKSRVAWGTSKDDVKRAVEKFKATILKRINEIEEKLMHEIDAAKPGPKLDESTVDKQVEEIQDVLKQFNFVTKHGSEGQIFRLINTMKTNVPRMFNDISILISSEASSRLVFEESNTLSMIESLGSITVKRNPFDVKFNPHKIQQAQEMVQRIPSKFQCENSISINVEGVDDGLCCQLTVPCPKLPPVVQFRELEVAKKSVKLKKKLYSGDFSDVYAGKWRKTVVAVKTLKQGTMSAEDFLSEAKLMHKLRHHKLVQMLAVCTIDEPIWIITELMVNRSLLDYLRRDEGKTIKLPIIVDMAAQIADGMTYLETENIVLINLRAASILVGERNEVKVAEFGLARLMQEDIYEADGPTKFPIRWTAPEAAFYGEFSIKSDVWSYGVLLYELITFGGNPYPGINNRDVQSKVESGVRMAKPNGGPIPCPDPYYDIMLQCWKEMAATRPTFAFLHDFFDNYFVTAEGSYREADCD